MKVGVYVDGYNLYYGARAACGRGTEGWRWLDIRSLVTDTITCEGSWTTTTITRLIYCTARVDASTNPSAHQDQDVYLKALQKSGNVTWIEYGNYVAHIKRAYLATEDPKTRRPQIATSQWPIMVKNDHDEPVRQARFMVSYLGLEEKGSDVNLATHLLSDVLQGKVDAAVVVSNDSDLALPLRQAREHVPTATINPPADAHRWQATWSPRRWGRQPLVVAASSERLL